MTTADLGDRKEATVLPRAEGVCEPRLTVWVLDDSPMEAMMARRVLLPFYDVVTFADGSELLENLAGGAGPNLLILDWHLPGMSGIEVCKFVRSTRNEMELPILMLTVYGHHRDLVDGLGAGANDYLTKPYDPPALVARVRTQARIHSLYRRGQELNAERVVLLERERAARADAESANLAKDEFLAMVSHELRSPLNAVLGWTRIVRGGKLSKEQGERALATIERSAASQAKIIEDLLDVSRILSGKLTIEAQPVDLVSAIGNSVDAIRPSATSNDIALELRIVPDIALIIGDSGRLEQMFGNLLTNAVKFTPRGGRIVVTLAATADGFHLSVADTGQGISAGFLPNVFDRFRQAEQGSRRAHGGLGLGLAIVKHVVELHGGSVSAHSDGPGYGATFLLHLPSAPSSNRRLSVVPPRPQGSEPSERLRGLRVLIVDDDADSVELLGEMLAQAGATILVARSAEDALRVLRKELPDVMVTDIGMPRRDGYELIGDVRALSVAEGGHTPAMALTGFARPDERARALREGFNICASKPIDPHELLVYVASLAGRFDSGAPR